MTYLHNNLSVPELVVLQQLSLLGAKTKLQLMSFGFQSATIDKLVRENVFVKKYDSTSNLYYFTVNESVIDGTRGS